MERTRHYIAFFRLPPTPIFFSIAVPQISPGRDAVADELLDLLGFGVTPGLLLVPQPLAVQPYFEYAAGAGNQRHLAKIVGEGREQLLRHP